MSPIIRAKCVSIAELECFSDLAVLLYYHVMSLGVDYDRIDLVCDRYFENSLKDDVRPERGCGTRLMFTNESPLPNKMNDSFLQNCQKKDDLNKYLAKKFMELHDSSKLLIVTFEDTVLCSPSEVTRNTGISITKCQSEEADQRLVRHTLHCLSDYQSYQRVV